MNEQISRITRSLMRFRANPFIFQDIHVDEPQQPLYQTIHSIFLPIRSFFPNKAVAQTSENRMKKGRYSAPHLLNCGVISKIGMEPQRQRKSIFGATLVYVKASPRDSSDEGGSVASIARSFSSRQSRLGRLVGRFRVQEHQSTS